MDSENPSEERNARTPLLSSQRNARKLSTFSGVFVPVCLSMFSALLFLRVGFVVGQAGVLHTLLQLLLAYTILVCTVLSVCAISTNGAIEGGGAYYMISRTLGPEFGGSIGTLFFFANIFGCALSIAACVEGLIDNFGPFGSLGGGFLPAGRWWAFLLGTVIAIFNLLICIIGASMFARTSLIIFGIVMISTSSVILTILAKHSTIQVPLRHFSDDGDPNATERFGNYTGLSWGTFMENMYPHYSVDYTTNSTVNFAAVFGVLFSGVTGIMAGANMSGDLSNPGKSIPSGTLWAVLFTFVTYLIMVFLSAASCSKNLLVNDYIYLQDIVIWAPLVAVGIFSATLSASLSTMIGASRVLEAMAKDDLFGVVLRPIVRATYKGNPIGAVVASWALVQIILLIGSLNVIAQMTSVLFLVSYLATNLACLGLTLASAPNFRPSFERFSWHTCMVGLVGTLSMMFVISPIYAAVCIIVCLLLIIALHLRAVPADWGSISQALIFHQVRKYLLLLDSRKDHVKFWRPQMLLLVSNPRSARHLIEFVNDLKKGGLYILGHAKVGDYKVIGDDPLYEEYPFWLQLIDTVKVKAFVEVTIAPSVREGMQHLARIAGLGAMKPNTLVLGFYDTAAPVDLFSSDSGSADLQTSFYSVRRAEESKSIRQDEYVDMMLDSKRLRKNLCVCRNFHLLDKKALEASQHPLFIDVWPVNLLSSEQGDLSDTTTLFTLQLACVLHMVSTWKHHTILRVLLTGYSDLDVLQNRIKEQLNSLRISACVSLVVADPLMSLQDTNCPTSLSDSYVAGLNDVIRQHCQHTAVTFIYLPLPSLEDVSEKKRFLRVLDLLTADLPPTVLVHGVSAVTTTSL